MTRSKSTDRDDVDVAIVGAGVSGLYCAWRLQRDLQPRPSVRIFEQDDRVGGRLLSVDLLSTGSRKAELGGMRYTDEQKLVRLLIQDLRTEFAEDSATLDRLTERPFDFNTKLAFLREHRTIDDTPDGIRPTKVFYELRDRAAKSLRDLAVSVAKRGICEALQLILSDPLSPGSKYSEYTKTLKADPRKGALTAAQWRTWQETAKISGLLLSNIGFWNMMQRTLDPDEFLFLHDALGYESLVANSNAAQAIPAFLADFAVEHYFTLHGGMEAIPKTLAARLLKQDRRILSLKSRVHGIARRPDGRFDIALTKGTSTRSCVARTVILAIPKAGLENLPLTGFGPAERRFRNDDIPQVTSHPAFKLFLKYESAWWAEQIGSLARAVTDLPIRQVYYLGDLPDREAFIMASYSDDHYVDFWAPLVNDPDRSSQDRANHIASARLKVKAAEQLEKIHGLGTLPAPVEGRVKMWPQAWHWWNVHTKPWDAAEQMKRPFGPSRNLFTCGEAYSLEQGWVEGALKSAERVLQELGAGQRKGIRDFAEYVTS